MFQKIFGSGKSSKPAKTHPKEDGIGSGSTHRHADPAQSESIPIATNRTTNTSSGKHHRNSSLSDPKLVSSPTRSGVATPASPMSPGASSGVVPAHSFSTTIRSDPVPAGFKNINTTTNTTGSGLGSSLSASGSITGSPKHHTGSLHSPVSVFSFNSPLSQHGQRQRPFSASVTNVHIAANHGSSAGCGGVGGGGDSSRPVPVPQRVSSPELQLSHTVPAFRSSPMASHTNRGTLVSNSSLAIGPGAADGGGGSNVNYWRLPWMQQKVVMCPYCQRPVRPRRPAQMNSKEFANGDNSQIDDEDSDESPFDSRSSSSSSEGSAGAGARHPVPSSPLVTYCRCSQNSPLFASADGTVPGTGQSSTTVSGLARHTDSSVQPPPPPPPPPQSQQVPPPVFIVETERSSKIVVPGTIADDGSSSSDDDDDEGNRRPVKLSLISPLTSTALLRNASYGGVGNLDGSSSGAREGSRPVALHTAGASRGSSKLPSEGGGLKGRETIASVPSVSSWLQEQQEHLPPGDAGTPSPMDEKLKAKENLAETAVSSPSAAVSKRPKK